MSREFTREEVQDKFLTQVEAYVKYWSSQEGKSKEEALRGLAFSLLVILDGGSMNLPGFHVIPMSSEEDRAYYIENNMNYYPEFDGDEVDCCDIAGGLHEIIYKRRDQ